MSGRDDRAATGAVAPERVATRPVAPGDEAFLRAVYASSRADELAAVPWSPEERQAFVDMQYRAQRDDYQRRFPDAEHSVVSADGEAVGRIWVRQDADELRLLDVTILPEQQGRGIGTVLLRRLQERAAAAGLPLRHTVLTSNDGAIRLYGRLGFEVAASTETHHLMQWAP